MKIAVTPTRIVLLKTKKRASLAKRGHKLLKDKLDGLIGKFIEIAKQTESKLNELNKTLPKAFSHLILASAQMDPAEFEEVVSMPKQKISVEIEKKNFMGVKVPVYKIKIEGTPVSYGLISTPLELDQALLNFNKVLPELVSLASSIKTLELISKEIIKTKRRVNALEHVLIPELTNAISFIKMKLAEMERSYLTSLMKIKDMVRAR